MRIIYTICLLLFASLNTVQGQADQSGPQPKTTKQAKVYPLPAVSQVTFEFDLGYDKNYSFQIFNFSGKKVYEVYSITPKIVVNVSDFYRGVYIFQVKDRNGKIAETNRFQVVH
jgi:hypothetical protein